MLFKKRFGFTPKFWFPFISIIVGIPFLYYIGKYLFLMAFAGVSMGSYARQQYDKVENADYHAILSACRTMIIDIDSLRPFSRKNMEHHYLDIKMEKVNDCRFVPDAIKEIEPAYFFIDTNKVTLVFLGGFDHLALSAFKEGIKGYGTKELVPGLWLQTEGRYY